MSSSIQNEKQHNPLWSTRLTQLIMIAIQDSFPSVLAFSVKTIQNGWSVLRDKTEWAVIVSVTLMLFWGLVVKHLRENCDGTSSPAGKCSRFMWFLTFYLNVQQWHGYGRLFMHTLIINTCRNRQDIWNLQNVLCSWHYSHFVFMEQVNCHTWDS